MTRREAQRSINQSLVLWKCEDCLEDTWLVRVTSQTAYEDDPNEFWLPADICAVGWNDHQTTFEVTLHAHRCGPPPAVLDE